MIETNVPTQEAQTGQDTDQRAEGTADNIGGGIAVAGVFDGGVDVVV